MSKFCSSVFGSLIISLGLCAAFIHMMGATPTMVTAFKVIMAGLAAGGPVVSGAIYGIILAIVVTAAIQSLAKKQHEEENSDG